MHYERRIINFVLNPINFMFALPMVKLADKRIIFIGIAALKLRYVRLSVGIHRLTVMCKLYWECVDLSHTKDGKIN